MHITLAFWRRLGPSWILWHEPGWLKHAPLSADAATAILTRRPMIHQFHIADMAATIVSDGPLVLPRAGLIFNGPTEQALDAAVIASNQPTDAVRIEQNCL